MRTSFRLVLAAGAIALAAGCASSPSSPGFGTMRVRMTDAPGDYDAVNLVIAEVSARREGAVSDSDSVSGEWLVLSDGSATYDLLDLRNGVFVTIGEASVPAGRYSQVRLRIGSGSTVVVNGTTYPLVVPSGAQSGLKLVGDFDVPDGGVFDIGLDFDAARSIHETGNGTWMLRPVVKVMPVTASGSIRGQIVPDSIAVTIHALQAPDTLGSTTAAIDGRFQLSVLAPGTYDLAVDADSGYRDTTLAGIIVSAGAVTDVGPVTLAPEN
jgi:hypothetical protein